MCSMSGLRVSGKEEELGEELEEVGRAEPSDGVPARLDLETVGAAAGVRAVDDVVERRGEGRVVKL